MSTPAGTEGQEPQGQQGAGQGQEPPANGTEGQEPEGQGQQTTGQQGDQFDVSQVQDPAVRAYLEKVQRDAQEARQEAARYRTERNALTEQVTEFQRANETAEQRAERERQERDQAVQAERERIATLEAENRTLRVGGAIREAARDAFNPNLVVQMLSQRVELDDQGQPKNLQDLLGGLRQSDPYLFRRTSQDAGAGNGGGQSPPPGGMNDLIRGAVATRRGRTTT